MNERRVGRIGGAAVCVIACAMAACAGPAPVTTSLVATLGPSDTVAVERYTQFGDTLITGTGAVAYPRAGVRSYAIAFDSTGEVTHVHLATGRPGQDATTVGDWTFTGDSVRVETRRDTVTQRYAVAVGADRPLPFFEDMFVFWDVSLRRAMDMGVDSASFATLAGRQVLPISFRRDGAVSVDFSYPDWGTVHGAMDPEGRLEGLNMTETTSKYTVVTVDTVDVQGRAMAWDARPAPGALSPRDSARATVGRAHVVVDYGRPSVRGRSVYGGELIPFGQVWRTGANAATQLITDRPLVMNGTTIPAGTYSVWSEATDATTWTLIINKQHGQWGTQYDASQDLARAPIARSDLAPPVARFTITVASTGGSTGTLTLAWGGTQGVVNFTVR